MSVSVKDSSLVDLLQKTGKSQIQIARELGLNRQATVSDWITGKHAPRLFPWQYAKLLKILNCTPDELEQAFSRSDNSSTNKENAA